MSEERITCGQCVNGPTAGLKKKKCVWSGDIRGKGALACKAHFASSVDSDLRCTKCSGPLGYFDALSKDDLCSRCVKDVVDKQAQRERFLCRLAGCAIFATAVVWIVGAGLHRGWW
jgi:hypothetical protein